MAVHLPPFDPSREFVAQRFFRLFGTVHEKGAKFPKDVVDERKLRQLYETHHINYEGTCAKRFFPPLSPRARAASRAVAAPAGAEQTAAEAAEAAAHRLENAHTHDELFKKAIGVKGVRKAMTKIEIARALVEAGRAGDGTA